MAGEEHSGRAEAEANGEAGGRRRPDISVVVPVNAQSDLGNITRLLQDLARYAGPHALEKILVVNNFAPGEIPSTVKELRKLDVVVLAIPSTRRPGEAIVLSARMPGVRAARTECVVLFDADCRIPDPTALLDWYFDEFEQGAQAAYSPVQFYDFADVTSVRLWFAAHHASRWVKRVVLGIPTTRGSNYAVRRQPMLDFYDKGLLADDLNVGPTFKRFAPPVVYGSEPELTVYTSGRMYPPGWARIPRYLMYRLRYNFRVLPVRPGVARYTGRDNDPISRYHYGRETTADEHQAPPP